MAEQSSSTTRLAETYVAATSDFTKEIVDVALAAALLRSGTLGERELAAAMTSWSIHGSTPLGSHLIDKGLIDRDTCAQMEQEALQDLSGCEESGAPKSASGILHTLEALDDRGGVARLLGIRDATGVGPADANDVRQSTSRYRRVRLIGRGGMGRVWLAYDEHLNRYVALKAISERASPTDLQRFRREAELTGRLEHPGIVPVHELGCDQRTGESFYVMRFLGKRTLHDEILEYHERIAEGNVDPMQIRRLLTAFTSICQAIGHAHSRKVIHRDLKPENVAIDSFGQVLVIDWGLAKLLDDFAAGDIPGSASKSSSDLDGSTLNGEVLGTPLYMAPEQAAGRIDDLDERTDIYGLGAILYAILTGRAPHEQTRSASEASHPRALISAIASEPTPRARELNPRVDPALEAICHKAMARRPYTRYDSAVKLADEVQCWMAGEPVTAYREPLARRATRWVRNHGLWSQLIAVAVIVAVVSLATFGIAARQEHVAHLQSQFDSMEARTRELELELKGEAADLAQDVRFMSTLPPIQALVMIENGGTIEEGEDVWRGRLEVIYEGLLRANPDYLGITFAQGDESGAALARVERYTSDAAYVRRVPVSRLGNIPRGAVVQTTAALPPGQINLSIDRGIALAETGLLSLHMVAAIPVYDNVTGNPFGAVAIESNLAERVAAMLEQIDRRDVRIIVADHQGQIWLRSDPVAGVEVVTRAVDVGEMIPSVVPFFTDTEQRVLLDRSNGVVAKRIQIGPVSSRVNVVVVMERVEVE